MAKDKKKTQTYTNNNIESEKIDIYLADDIINVEDIVLSDESKEIINARSFIDQEKESYIRIDKEFETFLCNYVNAQRQKDQQKLYLKEWFFWIVMLGFFSLMIK